MTLKRCILLLIHLTSLTTILACGPYYPQGEDLRFSLFEPEVYGFYNYTSFYYSAHSFRSYEDFFSGADGKCENIAMWELRCTGDVKEEDIMEAVYESSYSIDTKNITNTFVKHLLNEDIAGYEYLKFAWQCSSSNQFLQDPWEKNYGSIQFRTNLIEQAVDKARKASDKGLKKRYAFLAIRASYYDENWKLINELYETYFSNNKNKTIIDRWATFFKAIAEEDYLNSLVYAAKTFQDTPDKRFRINQIFNPKNGWKSAICLAKTNEEKEAIWLLEGISKHKDATESIKAILNLNPKSNSLKFLVQREINKLEDWILTPYFTEFQPSLYRLVDQEIWESVKDPVPYTSDHINKQVLKDRAQANNLLVLLNSNSSIRNSRDSYWLSVKSNLLYLSGNEAKCISLIESALRTTKFHTKAKRQLRMLYFLAKLKSKKHLNTTESEEINRLLRIEKNNGNGAFLFAYARELEFQGKTTKAALLFSFVTNNHINMSGSIAWKSKKRESILWNDFYYEYDCYLDAHYNTEQTKAIIDEIYSQNPKFPDWMYSHVIQDSEKLKNLLGTKYLREDNLDKALDAFSTVNDTIWSQYPYQKYLDANPFFTTLSGAHEASAADTVKFTKPELLKELISFKKCGRNPNNSNQARDLLKVANCYYNMSYHGNSWIMSRSYWSSNHSEHGLQDDPNYFGAVKAREYYLKAREVAIDEKLRALCLYMAARCEDFYKEFATNSEKHSTITINKYDEQFKKEYSNSYQEFSTCESFTAYLSEVLNK